MIMNCYRCGKEIDTPDNSNANYIIAKDTVVREMRDTLFALKDNQVTLAKKERMKETETYIDEEEVEWTRLKHPHLRIKDSEYDHIEIPNFKASKNVQNVVKLKSEMIEKDIQKTGIICPLCLTPGDFIIWGVDKPSRR